MEDQQVWPKPGQDWKNTGGAEVQIEEVKNGRVHYTFWQHDKFRSDSCRLDMFLQYYKPNTK